MTAATWIALLMIAQQVGAKATRDALFLAHFDVTVLPRMLGASALIALPSALLAARGLSRFGPHRVIPAAFVASAALLGGLAALLPVAPRAVAVLFYLHIAAFGGVLVSGFWSVLNERFDPHAMREHSGRIGSGATFGGLVGGLVATAAGWWGGAMGLLPVWALLHLACALGLRRSLTPGVSREANEEEVPSLQDGMRSVARNGYLRNLASLVVLGTIGAACVDYVFKARVQELWGATSSNLGLLVFFGAFHTGIGLITFLLQSRLAGFALRRWGLARTAATLPGGLTLASLVALAWPTVTSAVVVRAVESGLRSSLFRSAYEPLYTPVPPAQKRSGKVLVDVAGERLGDAVGAGLVQAAVLTGGLLLPLGGVESLLMVAAVLIGLLGLAITRRLHGGYVGALEQRLVDHDAGIDPARPSETVTETIHMRALESPAASGRHERADVDWNDPLARDVAELRSGDTPRVLRVLATRTPLPTPLVGAVVPLLAWDEAAETAVLALRRSGRRSIGPLIGALLDEEESFTVRRRAPRALPSLHDRWLIEGLLLGLETDRFEIRYQCAQALTRIAGEHGIQVARRSRIYDLVLRESRVAGQVWRSHRLLDATGGDSPFLDERLQQRSSRALEHVFTLLGLALPTDSLLIAYKGLLTDDRPLRGTALEYLESVLPSAVRAALWPHLSEEAPSTRQSDDEEASLERLLRSTAAIDLSLLRQRKGEPPAGGSPTS